MIAESRRFYCRKINNSENEFSSPKYILFKINIIFIYRYCITVSTRQTDIYGNHIVYREILSYRDNSCPGPAFITARFPYSLINWVESDLGTFLIIIEIHHARTILDIGRLD
jgi:hypothetical protein